MKLENRVAHCLQLYIKSEFTCLKRRRKWPILYNFHYGTRRGAGISIIGGADIHIFVFTDCKNNRFQKKLIGQNTNIWISAPPIIDIPAPLGTRATGSNFQEYAFWDMAYSKNAIAKLVNFKILIAIYKKIAGFINKNFLELDSACLNL
jgi:hypothetical protein